MSSVIVNSALKVIAGKQKAHVPRKVHVSKKSVVVFTDASLMKDRAGIAYVAVHPDKKIQTMSRSVSPDMDINFLELLAVYSAVRTIDSTKNIVICTDSKSAIHHIHNSGRNEKYTMLARAILEAVSRREGTTSIRKVKSKSPGNKTADRLAKFASKKFE
jgi:ribonuclease HI